jgi:hypothetical protein
VLVEEIYNLGKSRLAEIGWGLSDPLKHEHDPASLAHPFLNEFDDLLGCAALDIPCLHVRQIY